TNNSMICRRARDPPRMNQHTVAALEVRRVSLELEGKVISIGNNLRYTDRSKILHAELEPAVVEKIGQVLIRIPSLALDQPCKSPEVVELGTFWCAGPIAKEVGRVLAPRSCP